MSEIRMFVSRILIRPFYLNPWKDYYHEIFFPTWWNVFPTNYKRKAVWWRTRPSVRPSAHLPVCPPASPPVFALVSETKTFVGFLWNSVRDMVTKSRTGMSFMNIAPATVILSSVNVFLPVLSIFLTTWVKFDMSYLNVMLSIYWLTWKSMHLKAMFYSIFRLVSSEDDRGMEETA